MIEFLKNWCWGFVCISSILVIMLLIVGAIDYIGLVLQHDQVVGGFMLFMFVSLLGSLVYAVTYDGL